jgi:hypothetical protein
MQKSCAILSRLDGELLEQMQYQITWEALTKERGNVNCVDAVEASSALEALQALRSPIISRLGDFGPFVILKLSIKTTDGNEVTVNLQEAYKFLNSLNAEGGLVKYEDPPSTFTIHFGDQT